MSTERYTNIANLNSDFKNQKIPAYIPELNDFDYKRGFVIRYFVQKSNDNSAPIFEVSSDDLSKYSNNSFFKTIGLDWRLIGSDEEIRESNFKSVKLASQKMPAIQLYLPNLLQFRKK